MNIDYKVIGAKIKSQRKKAGITQETLAEKLDVSIGYISQVERGITKISLDLLAAISSALECDICALITDSVTKNNYLAGETAQKFSALSEREKRMVNSFIDMLVQNR